MINIRTICVSVLLLHALTGSAAQGKVYGTVKSDDGKPVASCVIKAANSNLSTYSNELGEFSLEFNTDSSKSLVFLGLGYETTEVSISGDTLRAILKRKVKMLSDAVVAADHETTRTKRGMLGKKNTKPYGICAGHTGNEWAIFLQADSTHHGILEKIYYYITKEGLPNSKFRVHVYDIDTGYMPGNDLLDSVIILHANEGDEWVTTDVSSLHIPVGRSIFISMEWIAGYGNDPNPVTSKKFPAQAAFNGQVLAFTEGYYKRGSLCYVRKDSHSTWHYIVCAGSLKRNTLNPMIYATYLYHKK